MKLLKVPIIITLCLLISISAFTVNITYASAEEVNPLCILDDKEDN